MPLGIYILSECFKDPQLQSLDLCPAPPNTTVIHHVAPSGDLLERQYLGELFTDSLIQEPRVGLTLGASPRTAEALTDFLP